MPQTVKNSEGADIEVFTKEELEAEKAEASKKAQEAEDKIKELEQELNPNWREARKKMEILEKERDDWKTKAEGAGVKPEPTGVSPDEAKRIAEEAAGATYVNRYKDRVLSGFGDKREIVAKYFEKLTAGEQLDEAKIEQFANDAARAAGVLQQANPLNRAIAAGGGSAPEFREAPKDGFGDSEAGKSTAAAMGLQITAPKKQ